MLLHVIWGFAEDVSHEQPTFSVTGMMLHRSGRPTAHVRQRPFRWCGEAWEAEVEIAPIGAASDDRRAVLRLSPEVWRAWSARALNARAEAARQLRAVVDAHGWERAIEVVTLQA